MKKGKRGWILLLAFTTWAALIAGCGKCPGNKPEKKPKETTTPLPKIQELTYYMHGTMMGPIWSVSLIRRGEEALVRVEPWDEEEEEFYDYPAEAEILEKARVILETYDVASWAGFRGRDPNVLDGYSMGFQVEFTDGSKIEAFGENQFPKNCHAVFSELNDLTAEARNKFTDEGKQLMQCF